MLRVTKFGVLPIFRGLGGRLKPLRVIEAASADEAKRKADVFASVVGGAVAFASTGDAELDAWEAPRIIARHGEVPEGLMGADFDP